MNYKAGLFSCSLVIWTILSSFAPQSRDRYAGFSAYYDPYTISHPRHIPWEDLPKQGYDVTSCFSRSREKLINILNTASTPSQFDEAFPRLHVESEGKIWVVDENGVVRHDGKDRALSRDEFTNLLVFIVGKLPYNDHKALSKVRNTQ